MRTFAPFLCLVLFGCASGAPTGGYEDPASDPRIRAIVDEVKEEARESLSPDLGELELYRMGGDIFCTEPEFLECMLITRQACDAEGREYVHDCIASAKAAQGQVRGQAGMSRMVHDYTFCMADRFLERRDRESIEACLNSTLK